MFGVGKAHPNTIGLEKTGLRCNNNKTRWKGGFLKSIDQRSTSPVFRDNGTPRILKNALEPKEPRF